MSSPTEQSSAFVDLSPSGDGDRSAEFRTVKQAPGSVVAFPLNAQARLNQLAQEIKECFADLGVDDHSPVMLRVIGGAEPQLWIDSGSYVQFRGERGGYHIVLDDAFDMRMTFETAKIEDVSHMVRAYIVARVVDAGRAVRAWHD
jgi:hypothetical protein